MSDSDSDTETYPLIDDFTKLASLIKRNDFPKKKVIKEEIKDLNSNINKFFEIYSDSVVKKALYNDVHIFFDKIQNVITSFIKYINFINDKKDFSEIVIQFQNDLRSFTLNLSNLIICCTDILERIKRMVIKDVEKKYLNKVLNQFYLEIAIFEYAHNIKIVDQPPYYQISSFPIYKYLHHQIHASTNKFLNIIGPHGSGKTSLVPLLLASRSLGYTIKSQFIIVIENDISSIENIKTLYKYVNTIKNEYMNDGENCLLITSSLAKFYDKSKRENDPTIIAILTPIDGLQLIRKMIPDSGEDLTFLKKSTFIIDDINQRKAETDVLSQNILNNIFNNDLIHERAKLVLLGTYSDSRFLTIFGRHCDSFKVPIQIENIQINEIKCKSFIEIEKIAMISEMKNFLDSWLKNDEVNIGSVIVFVPNVKTGRSLKKNLFKIYQNYSKVIPLQTRINKNESIQGFNERLLNDIDKALIERSENPVETFDKHEINNDDVIFILPIDLTGSVNDEEKQLIQSTLPPPLVEKKLVKVIIATNQNEHLIKIPDASVIFDSGLTETEYYDANKCVSMFKTEQLPNHDINQRNTLMDDNEKNAHFIFAIQNHKKMLNLSH